MNVHTNENKIHRIATLLGQIELTVTDCVSLVDEARDEFDSQLNEMRRREGILNDRIFVLEDKFKQYKNENEKRMNSILSNLFKMIQIRNDDSIKYSSELKRLHDKFESKTTSHRSSRRPTPLPPPSVSAESVVHPEDLDIDELVERCNLLIDRARKGKNELKRVTNPNQRLK